ncbi:DUF6344 domain-containing protein [Streptomyces sp. R28]|jgi:hypothetical protein|uniref:DUF6344 domain-containing protein n=1 Tax=Streptomyces sp. R28 TaxID=3238628 RepID=A0AB39Q3E7_9ACTN
MARNKVMNLWTTIVTAFLALCTALGFVTTSAAAAAPHKEASRKSDSDRDTSAQLSVPAMPQWAWSYARALPPTMKQRIRAEAHGKTPSCRHRPLTDTETAPSTAAVDACDSAEPPAQPLVPHQR